MKNEYIDLLLAERADGSVALVVAEAHDANVGGIVEFNGGELGRVAMRAWGGERDGEVHHLVTALVPTYEAEALYFRNWKREDGQDAENS